MNIRSVTVFLVLGMTAALFLTHARLSHHSPMSLIGTSAAAQSPDVNSVVVNAVPNTINTPDSLWQHFKVTVPATNPPLDMHVAFLVDGKGTDYITKQSMPWQQEIPLKIRVDQDDDNRVKAILKAQGLPVNSRLVTYHFSCRSNGNADADETLTFIHSSAGSGAIQEIAQANRKIGDKIMLYQSAAYDDLAFKSPLYRPADDWHPEGYAKRFPFGFVHRLTVYVQFQPHTGPPVRNGVVFGTQPTQLPDTFDTTKI